jgi:hypothetical protein
VVASSPTPNVNKQLQKIRVACQIYGLILDSNRKIGPLFSRVISMDLTRSSFSPSLVTKAADQRALQYLKSRLGDRETPLGRSGLIRMLLDICSPEELIAEVLACAMSGTVAAPAVARAGPYH